MLKSKNLEKVESRNFKIWEPKEQLKARIVLIFEKGNTTSNLDNYRPIALLSSMCKIFAAIIQRRIEEQIDSKLQRTQYGFRKKERNSTSHSYHT